LLPGKLSPKQIFNLKSNRLNDLLFSKFFKHPQKVDKTKLSADYIKVLEHGEARETKVIQKR